MWPKTLVFGIAGLNEDYTDNSLIAFLASQEFDYGITTDGRGFVDFLVLIFCNQDLQLLLCRFPLNQRKGRTVTRYALYGTKKCFSNTYYVYNKIRRITFFIQGCMIRIVLLCKKQYFAYDRLLYTVNSTTLSDPCIIKKSFLGTSTCSKPKYTSNYVPLGV